MFVIQLSALTGNIIKIGITGHFSYLAEPQLWDMSRVAEMRKDHFSTTVHLHHLCSLPQRWKKNNTVRLLNSSLLAFGGLGPIKSNSFLIGDFIYLFILWGLSYPGSYIVQEGCCRWFRWDCTGCICSSDCTRDVSGWTPNIFRYETMMILEENVQVIVVVITIICWRVTKISESKKNQFEILWAKRKDSDCTKTSGAPTCHFLSLEH